MEKEELSKKQNSIRSFSGIFNYILASFCRFYNSAFGKYSILKNVGNYNSAGFTLVELVTAIGIFTILSSIAITVLDPLEQFRKAQDSRRKSDLAQIQRALESYYQDYGRYPAYTGCCGETADEEDMYTINLAEGQDVDSDVVSWGEEWSPYIDLMPIDPNSNKRYLYWSNPDNEFQSYAIYASLDRGGRDPDACDSEGFSCGNVPEESPGDPEDCGSNDENCNFGVTSPNISP